MDVRAHYRRLLAIREMLDAELEELAPLVDQGEADTNDECSHPEGSRVDLRVMGNSAGEHWLCKLCHHEYQEASAEVVELKEP